ncbi:hypothetical protein [uncultured Corynebacterium sp.]|nr:hypothetical protein [uncultured Corynebacterium sp.]
MIRRTTALIGFKACGDALSSVKPVLIVEDGLYSCTNKTVGMHL